jgi:lysine N6-hydroxylase
MVNTRTEGAHYKVVGVGVGPANLSLACLAHGDTSVPGLFLDRKPAFGWHDGQLLPGAALQVSTLKDLVTLRDPTNSFSFLNYLHSQGRIYHFANARFDAVRREEFRDYLAWAAARNDDVTFGETIHEVGFDGRAFRIRTDRRSVTADNVSVGVGTRPWVPEQVRPLLGRTQFHVGDYMTRARSLGGKRVCVVGGGQSGAEAFLDLISRTDERERPRRVLWISRRPGYLPIDDSPFTNEFYMPDHADHLFDLEPPLRAEFNRRHLLSSDGVTGSTLEKIYQALYVHHFQRRETDFTALYPHRDVVEVRGDDRTGWALSTAHLGRHGAPESLEADVIVWATGFRRADTGFLAPIEHRLAREDDEYQLDANFAVRWDGPEDRAVFLQNGARNQWGHADANLSLIAWRSGRILDRLRGTHSDEQRRSFVEWGVKPTTAAERP